MDKIYEKIPIILEVLKVIDALAEWFSTPFGIIGTIVSALTFTAWLRRKLRR